MANFKVSLSVECSHIVLRVFLVSLFLSLWNGGEWLSKNPRSSDKESDMVSEMEPKMTSDGKYLCEADNSKFNTREDYDKHCSEAHTRSRENKEW